MGGCAFKQIMLEEAYKSVKDDGMRLRQVGPLMQNNRTIVLAVALEFASHALQADKDVVLQACYRTEGH